MIFAIGFALPLLNAPLLAALTVRTPQALRPKVMTALISINTLLGPLGYAVVGPLVAGLGLAWTYGIIAAGSTLAGLVFLAGTLDADGVVTMPAVAGEEAARRSPRRAGARREPRAGAGADPRRARPRPLEGGRAGRRGAPSSPSSRRRGSSPAAARSSPMRSTPSGSTRPGSTASTSAPPPAASPTSSSSAAPPA